MKKTIITLATLGLASGIATAATINIAMHNGGVTVNQMNPANAPTTQGTVVNTATDTWNNYANNGGVGLSFGAQALSLSDGTASGATIAVNSGFSSFTGTSSTNKDHAMMAGWYGFVGAEAITLSNLGAADANGYTVTIYGDVDTVRTMNYTINGTTQSIIDDGSAFNGTFSAENSVTFANITGSNTLNITGNTSGGRSGINGVVINYTEAVTTPEPSSVALLGLGGLALILHRRK